MHITLRFLVCAVLASSQHLYHVEATRKFPKDFLFGSSTSAYQIEGAWNIDGKSENIWDHMTHEHPESISDRSNADVTADSYHNYKRDVEIARELGLDIYRMSISWSRLLPTGFTNQINEAAVIFYNNYFDELLKYNIIPFVTLYHWDLPQSLQDLGGLVNPLVAEWFEDYARIAFQLFGSRVKHWITFNDPYQLCTDGYGLNNSAPQIRSNGIGEYICYKNVLMSHARAYRLYDTQFRDDQYGEVGIAINVRWYTPHTESPEDKMAAELKRQGFWGIVSNPIFSVEGGFQKEILERIATKSADQGYPKSRLTDFTDEERKFIQGTHDFMGINYYRNALVSATKGKFVANPVPSIIDDVRCGEIVPDTWWKSSVGGMEIPQHGISNVLLQIHEKYNTTMYVTENGIPTGTGFDDDERVFYLRTQLLNVLDAIDAGINVKGYMARSMMDNFEWNSGYTERFGFYEVNFTDEKRTRSPRKSAFAYKHIISTRTVEWSYEPKVDDIMTIESANNT